MNAFDFSPISGAAPFGGFASAPTGLSPYPSKDALAEFIREAAQRRKMDPAVAERVYQSEGGSGYVGDAGTSFGPFMLHYGQGGRGFNQRGLGNEFTEETGLDARDPRTWKQQVNFALDNAARNKSWGPWYGWKGAKDAGLANATPVGDYKNALGESVTQPPSLGQEEPMNTAFTLGLGGAGNKLFDWLMPDAQAAEATIPVAPPEGSGAVPGATKVKTVPIAGGAFTPGSFTGQPTPAPAGAYTPSEIDTGGLVDLYKSRLASLEAGNKPESARDMVSRMLTNFGSGAYQAAGNIAGRKIGPSFGEALAGATSNMSLGEEEEKTNAAARKDKADERSWSALSDIAKLHLEIQKENEARRYKSAELAERAAGRKEYGTTRPPYEIIESTIQDLVDQGMSRSDAIKKMIEADPRLREILGFGGY